MQTYNSFNEMVAGQNASPLKSDMSVFNISDEDYMKIQNGLQGILNVLKQPEWRADLSVEQRDGLESIRSKTEAIMVAVKNWHDADNAVRHDVRNVIVE